MFAYSALIN